MRIARAGSMHLLLFLVALTPLAPSCSRPSPGTFPYDAGVVDRQDSPATLVPLRGHPVVFVAYAASMPDCRKRIGHLVALSDAYPSAGIRFVAFDVNRAAADKFAEAVPEYRGNVLFLKERSDEVSRALKIGITPTTFLVSADGRIRDRIESVHDWDSPDFRQRVDALVRGR